MNRIVLSLMGAFCCFFALDAQNQSLNANWQFQLSEREMPSGLSEENWTAINLPHSWNAVDAHDDVRGYFMGTAWYKKSLFIPKTKQNQIFLKFEGANQHTIVFVNGQKAGEHKGGYTAFVVDITPFIQLDADNELSIRVNNKVNKHIPPLSGDFTFYGGIYRDLWLVRKSQTHFDIMDGSTKGVYLSNTVSKSNAQLKVKAKVVQKASNKPKILTTSLYDKAMNKVAEATMNVNLPEGTSELIANINLSNPRLWSPDDPYLYTVELKLMDGNSAELEDHFVDKIGFRWFELNEDRSFSLNGKPLKLVGVNRHQDFPKLGNALPDAIHRKDMELLKEMGGNFIRIAHYPQDPAILEACDELGILAWEETPIVNFITADDHFTKNATNMVREMVRQHYNHTSVIMWGYMNEIMLGLKKGLNRNANVTRERYLNTVRQLATTLDSICKAEDPNRFTTIAHHAKYPLYEEAGLNEIADIIGWNIYYGWYGADFSRLGRFLDQFHKDHPEKGIIIAEYGAGADPRIHADEPLRFDFSVEWQTKLHTNYLSQIMDRSHVMGATAWNFVDFGSEGRSDAVPRINSKGILNVDRSPKDAYFFYQAALSKKQICKIGARDWRNRTGVSDSGVLEEPIYIFSNQAEVELILNGESLGNFAVKDFQLKANIPFKEGVNELVARTASAEDKAQFNIKILSRELTKLASTAIDLCMNLGSHVDFYDPIRDQYWLPEMPYQPGGIGYIGGQLMKTGNWRVGTGKEIVGSDLEPVYQTHRDMIQAFRADLPNGWYEVTLHFAEIYSTQAREKLLYNLGTDEEGTEIDVNRAFAYTINEEPFILISNMKDFGAIPIKTRVLIAERKGLNIQFSAINGSSILCGVEIRGL